MTFKGAMIAASVAGLFSTAAPVAAVAGEKTAGKVPCSGVNECKGKGQCHSASSSCSGQNTCKGKGVILVSEKDCKAKGGKVAPAKH